jgi:hypothetical protein
VVLMAADPLDDVLRLVAEGRLTADEAAPILAALDAAAAAQASAATAAEGGRTAGDAGRGRAGTPPGGFGFSPPPGFGEDAGDPAPAAGAPTSLRIEIRDGGRSVVNLRLPIAVGRFALDRVPGLSGEQADRVRDALRQGMRGPVLVVDDHDGGGGVLITLE